MGTLAPGALCLRVRRPRMHHVPWLTASDELSFHAISTKALDMKVRPLWALLTRLSASHTPLSDLRLYRSEISPSQVLPEFLTHKNVVKIVVAFSHHIWVTKTLSHTL